jgi:peptidoglycan hydrolase-like protein with peptidoglycan-binding domain
MKTLLSEIKKFRRLVKLNEGDDKDVMVALIGDQLTFELESNDFIDIPNLRDEDMTIDKLLMVLSKQNPMPEVDHVFVSIGINDKFQDKKVIPFLIDALDNIFPNAEINIIKAIVGGDFFYGNEEVEDFKELENQILDYYNTFKQNGITVLGNYPSLDYGLGDSNKSIEFLKKQMSDSLFQNITNYGQEIEPLSIDEPFIYRDNIDISGDDVTDFDTIYEFLDRFEEIVKSGNRYDSRVRGSFKPDIEQIQMALKFLFPNFDLEITGVYDTDTNEAIYMFQEQQNIEPTGIADQETLEEILFDLKAKSFDDDDLGKFLSDLGIVKTKESFLGGDVINLSDTETEVDYSKLLNDLKILGLTENAAKGLVANSYGESAFNVKAKGDSGELAAKNKNSININGVKYCSFGLWQYNICGGMGVSFLKKYGVDANDSDNQKKLDILFDYKKQVEFMADAILQEQRSGDKEVGVWIDWIVDNIERPTDKSGAKSIRRTFASDKGWL